ncbi:hypothetical protein [Antribacter gilvus]|uniref:hypothetical protein n=1 Tax=Antribacter gilvus TaxID=2304675 RepID=UPI000F784D38|nr:hypothetical protein [Antribacter gilvus]
MAVPDLIPIAHEPDYRTDTIGRYEGGQFFACVTYGGESRPDRQLFGVLHRFDLDGNHLGSEVRVEGDDLDVEAWLTDQLDALPGLEYADIAIRPFQFWHAGVLFGLVLEKHDIDPSGYDWAELYPNRLGFGEPWDGFCST